MKVLVKILFIFSLMYSCGNSEPRTSISEHEAKVVAESQVKSLLVSPSTAEFSSLSNTDISKITDGWKVSGFVDSQNRFGGTIRTKYTIE